MNLLTQSTLKGKKILKANHKFPSMIDEKSLEAVHSNLSQYIWGHDRYWYLRVANLVWYVLLVF